MSIWASVCGNITINKNCGISIKKLIQEMFDECIIREVNQKSAGFDNLSIFFEFCFSGDGVGAAKDIQEFVDRIRSADSKSYVQVTASIIF